MNQRFILKDVTYNNYWYGFYTSKKWTEDILDSYIFDDRKEIEDFIRHNEGNLEGMVLQVIEIWK
jgi:hypothetical protein